jgi:hypothetical protein
VLDGDPGLGKSTLLLDLAARVSRGHPMPDGAPGLQAAVTLLTAEDDLADTVRPRLEAAGADLARIHVFGGIGDRDGGTRPLVIPLDLALLRQVLERTGSRLLILDPFLAFLGGGVDSCKDQDVRRCLHRLADLAEQTLCAVVLLRHVNKGAARKALYRGGGSIGIVGAARSALLAGKDPDSDAHQVLASIKSNLAETPTSLRYALEKLPSGVCRVRWCGPSPLRADDLVAQVEAAEEREILREASDFLRTLLADGPLAADAVIAAARGRRISERTLRRAKARLGVESVRACQDSAWVWLWALPRTCSPGGDSRDPSLQPV